MATLHGDAKEAFVDFWNRAFAIGVLKSCIDGGFWIVADRNLAFSSPFRDLSTFRFSFWKILGGPRCDSLYKSVDRMQKHLDDMSNNKVNIEFLKEQMEKAQLSIEKLKDADREIVYKNGNGH